MRARLALAAVAALALAVTVGACSRRSNPVAPATQAAGVTVQGVVRDTTDAPREGAVVSLHPAAGVLPLAVHEARLGRAEASARAAAAVRVTTTGPNGAFSFADVPAGDYLLTAALPNYLGASVALSVPGNVPAPLPPIQLRVRATGIVEGRARLDGVTSHAGTVVYVEGISSAAFTDASGAYRLLDVPLGDWTVTAARAGYLETSAAARLTFAGEIATLADFTLTRDLNVPPTASLTTSGVCSAFPTRLTGDASDPDGSVVRFEYDFEDDGSVDTSGATLTAVDHRYPVGSHRAKLIVTDNRGARGVAVSSFTISAPETVYVSSTTGSSSGPGTRAAPYSTLGAALGTASGPCPRIVHVALGYYPESPSLPSNLVLRGGYDPSTWQQVPGTQTEIWVGDVPARAVNASNTTVEDLRFVAVDMTNPSTSSIAIVLDGCGPTLRFERCRFVAGSGQAGLFGQPGSTAGRNGYDGPNASGQTGGRYPPFWPFGVPRGADGPDGPAANAFAQPGATGHSGCPAPGTGGAAGTSVVCPGTPTHGGAGSPGQDGANGTQGGGLATNGDFNSALEWVPLIGLAGGSGCSGSGGGSGGAGGSTCTTAGGGGGAGAVSGSGGSGGFGGRGGGASIAVLTRDSSPHFESCEFVAASGGRGGDGGDGRAGGTRGLGGAGGVTGASTGGRGGDSGAGGGGGGGQGGPGGPSWCVVRLGTSSPTFGLPTYLTGTGGSGGLGGRLGGTGARAASGPNGPAAIFGP